MSELHTEAQFACALPYAWEIADGLGRYHDESTEFDEDVVTALIDRLLGHVLVSRGCTLRLAVHFGEVFHRYVPDDDGTYTDEPGRIFAVPDEANVSDDAAEIGVAFLVAVANNDLVGAMHLWDTLDASLETHASFLFAVLQLVGMAKARYEEAQS